MIEYFVFALVGKLLIYLIQKFPLTNYLSSKSKFLNELFSCGLCLGFWVYLGLAFIIEIRIIDVEIFGISEFLTACITSFVMYLVSSGWQENFGTIVIK